MKNRRFLIRNSIRRHMQELSGDYLCVSNVHTTVTAYEDPKRLFRLSVQQ